MGVEVKMSVNLTSDSNNSNYYYCRLNVESDDTEVKFTIVDGITDRTVGISLEVFKIITKLILG